MQSNRFSQVDEALKKAAARLFSKSLHSLMHEPARGRFIYQFEDLTVDCTRHLLDEDGMMGLLHLAESCNLRGRINDMFSGVPINTSEDRPVQHTATRTPEYRKSEAYQTLAAFAESVRRDPNITAVVNLGIGGSDLGPKMVTQALAGYHDGPACHFVGNI